MNHKPQPAHTYYAPISLASRYPLIYGEHWGVIVNGASQQHGVVYSTRQAAETALGNPAVWNERSRADVRIAALTYQGTINRGLSGFAFATTAEMVAHDHAIATR